MLQIRLRRVGATKQPSYPVVVAESSAPRDGRFVEIIGHSNPLTNPSTIVINAEKASKWIRNGAQPTDRVAKLFQIAGVDTSTKPSAEAAKWSQPIPQEWRCRPSHFIRYPLDNPAASAIGRERGARRVPEEVPA